MLVIRFLRAGKRNQPFYKIVVTDKKNPPRGGRFNEQVGFWNPLTKEKKLNADKIKNWIKNGAKPSPTVFTRRNVPQAFREITNFIRDNGDDWDEFCINTTRTTRRPTTHTS
ncbi:MAG: 30S ribosomal protein S16, partial [Candidatus Nealsonbacteria bacterium]|nr:30S ribosomal protein S16 [Candidatus Nealsonbacteria bacterium]